MSNYWAERQKQLNNQLEKDEKKLKEKLSAEYEKEAKKLEKEIAAYYKTYGEADVIEYRTLLQSFIERGQAAFNGAYGRLCG